MTNVQISTVNEKLLERYIRHSVYLEQLKTGMDVTIPMLMIVLGLLIALLSK